MKNGFNAPEDAIRSPVLYEHGNGQQYKVPQHHFLNQDPRYIQNCYIAIRNLSYKSYLIVLIIFERIHN